MKEYTLTEDRGHTVHVTEHGNPNGTPILSFHGGPGSGSKPSHAERFDLAKYRVILFDQRGCGKSTPRGELRHNTTEDILFDAERIRELLGIKEWFVTGSSWGSTLSLLYALKHTTRVRGLLLSAVFLADRETITWGMADPKGAARLMPDVWMRRMEFFKKFKITLETQNDDFLKALEGATLEMQKEITAGIKNWEGNLGSPQSPISYLHPEDITEDDIASAKVFVHYEKHGEFIPDNYIIDSVSAIAHLPTVIVHGRYDINCPLDKAYQLQQHMNDCVFCIATSSGHIFSAEGNELRRMAFDQFLQKQLGSR